MISRSSISASAATLPYGRSSSGDLIGTANGDDLVGQIFDAEGNPIGAEFQVNQGYFADDEHNAALASRPGGGFVVVYEDTDGVGTSIRVQVYDVDGNVVGGAPLTIAEDVGTDGLYNPSVAVQADGSFLVTYEFDHNELGTDVDIVGRIVDDTGTVGGQFDIYNFTDAALGPDVATLTNGNYIVVFQDESAGDSTNRDPVFRILDSTGAVVDSDMMSFDASDQTDVHVAALVGGGFVTIWTEENGDGNGDGIRARIYNNDGDAQGAAFTVNTSTTGLQYGAEVTALADGGFVVVWDDNNAGVEQGQRFDASGNAIGDEFVAGSLSAEMEPVVAALSDGRFIVGFDDVAGDPDVHATIFDPREKVIDGTSEDDVITSRKDGAAVYGHDGADTLLGQARDDILDGGAGIDIMRGRDGDDVYIVDESLDTAQENANEGTDTVVASADYAIGNHIENLVLTGGAVQGVGNELDNLITGNAGANVLLGLGGNDTLDGRTGADAMSGGTGNDIYIVDNAGDTVVEAAGAGFDTVRSNITFVLGANIEALALTDAANINGTGNGLANVIIGNAGANVLLGLGGADIIRGNGGNDTLDGGAGADTMVGGTGNDTYFVDNAGDVTTENFGQGLDTVRSSISFTLGANLENLVLTGTANINGTGNALANMITGNAGANFLSGLGGADTMIGGAGNDTYVVDNAGDVVVEAVGAGLDTVQSSIAFTLGAHLENLVLTGTANISGTGNALANTITGNAGVNILFGLDGDDRLDGGAGADTMRGGAGDDTYVVENAGDKVIEKAGEGTDLVESAVNFVLGANFENLTLTGSGAIRGMGNKLANVLTGNDGANKLGGRAGKDTLLGGAGNDKERGGKGADILLGEDGRDKLHGNAGKDKISGGLGKDKLWGGKAKDFFVFDSALGSGNKDRVKDFQANKDKFWLDKDIFFAIGNKLGKGEFTVGKKAHDGNDHLIHDRATGRIFFDEDGKGGVGKVMFARVDKGISLDHKDFHMIEDLVA